MLSSTKSGDALPRCADMRSTDKFRDLFASTSTKWSEPGWTCAWSRRVVEYASATTKLLHDTIKNGLEALSAVIYIDVSRNARTFVRWPGNSDGGGTQCLSMGHICNPVSQLIVMVIACNVNICVPRSLISCNPIIDKFHMPVKCETKLLIHGLNPHSMMDKITDPT